MIQNNQDGMQLNWDMWNHTKWKQIKRTFQNKKNKLRRVVNMMVVIGGSPGFKMRTLLSF